MKSLLKFSLLIALIISGKVAKQAAPATVAQNVKVETATDSTVLLVHQVYNATPVQPGREKAQPQQTSSSLIAEMF